MKKIWVLILLISLGFNLGLGLRLLQNPEKCTPIPETMTRGKVQASNWGPSRSDTTAWRQHAGRRLDRIAGHLNLTPAQKEVFAETRAVVGKQMMMRRTRMQEARTDLMELLTWESLSGETLRSSFRALAVQQSEIDSVITEVLLLELEVLDPQQRILYLEMMPMSNRGHQGMHGRSRGRRGPD